MVFAETGDAEVLGVTALETLGLEVDPVTGKLKYVGHLAFSTPLTDEGGYEDLETQGEHSE